MRGEGVCKAVEVAMPATNGEERQRTKKKGNGGVAGKGQVQVILCLGVRAVAMQGEGLEVPASSEACYQGWPKLALPALVWQFTRRIWWRLLLVWRQCPHKLIRLLRKTNGSKK